MSKKLELQILAKMQKATEAKIARLTKIVFSDATTQFIELCQDRQNLINNFDHSKASSEERLEFAEKFLEIQNKIEKTNKLIDSHHKKANKANEELARAQFELGDIKNRQAFLSTKWR